MTFQARTRLGPYEILEPIGAGGMGEVYKAIDTRLDRAVAIKVLPEHLAESPERKARFEREAKAISQLNHPHICTLYDVGRQAAVDFIVMEYIEGETLAERLKKGALKLDQALEYGVQIADGLDKAHRAGIVHRDLKPGNVMLTKSGVTLLDFGLARLVQREDDSETSDAPTRQKDLTAEESIIGTLQYMAPEQLERKPADVRTDIFAFGAVLYEMLTGRKAFEGTSQASLISAIMSSEPRPISEVESMSPQALDRLVRRCLNKDPDERWQTATDLTAELSWLRDGQHETRPGTGRTWDRWAWGAAAVATVVALALAATRTGPVPDNRDITRFSIHSSEGTAFAHFWARASPALSPDGRRVAFIARDDVGERIWVRSLDSLRAAPLEGTHSAGQLFWSPDSRSIGFFGEGALKKVDVSGGSPQTLVEGVGYSIGGTWSNEGVMLFSPLWAPIHQADLGENTADRLTALDASRHEVDHRWPQFLPDGEHFLFFVHSREAEYRGTYVASLSAPQDKRLVLRGVSARYASPGYLLFARDGDLFAQPFDVDGLQTAGDAVSLDEQAAAFYSHGLFSVSENEVLAYRSAFTSAYQLAWFDRTGNRLGVLPIPGGAQNPEISPDGARIAFDRWDPEIGTRDIWVYELSRRVATRFTFDPSDDSDPTWSPDGNEIAFSSGRNGYQSLYRRRASGSTEVEMIHQAEDEEWPMSWSPDGEHIVYSRFSSDRVGFGMLLPLSGSRMPTPLRGSDFEEVQTQFSPDGKWVSYTSNESGRNEVYVQPFPPTGAKLQISTAGGNDGRWRADGREIFYLAPDRTLMAVSISSTGDTLLPSAPKELFTAPTSGLPLGVGLRFLYAVSHDGERFVMSEVSPSGPDEMVVVLNWMAALEE